MQQLKQYDREGRRLLLAYYVYRGVLAGVVNTVQ
jgi:hypothetical protein